MTGSVQQTLKTGAQSMYAGGSRELEPLGGVVPTIDPYYTQDFNEPEYEYGGDVERPEYDCTLPEETWTLELLADLEDYDNETGKTKRFLAKATVTIRKSESDLAGVQPKFV